MSLLLSLIIWILLGTLVGWFVGGTQQRVTNIIIGIIGAFLGDFILDVFGIAFGISIINLLASLIGAILLLQVAKLFRRAPTQINSLDQANVQANTTPSLRSQNSINQTNFHTETSALKFKQQSMNTTDSVSFIGDVDFEEQTLVIGIEEVPLDNRFGSNTLMSEHEFSRKASRTIRIDRSGSVELRLQASVWSVLEAETRGSLAQSIGIDLQQEEFRRVTLRFEAAPGKIVLYRVIWRQTQRAGKAQMQVAGNTLNLPYVAIYGLSHSVESILQQTQS